MVVQRRSLGRTSRKPPTRELREEIIVFVEGQTEEAYLKDLRSSMGRSFKLKRIDLHAATMRFEGFCKSLNVGEPKKCKKFFVYDGDVLNEEDWLKIAKVPNAQAIISHPCIELWFYLHLKDNQAYIESDKIIAKLKKVLTDYEKGNDYDFSELVKKRSEAVKRCEKLGKMHERKGNAAEKCNPYSNMCKLVDYLEK